MPELPEVEVVRRGLAAHVTGARIVEVSTTGSRVLRRHTPGPADFAARVAGRQITAIRRRGKYLWLDLDGEGLVVHLGMSGQLLLAHPEAARPKHLHACFAVRAADGGDLEVHFVDQRTFGALVLAPLDHDGVPEPVAHIALDPFDPDFDARSVARRITQRASGIKRQLLDQSIVSGIGNIYADEALWRARIHGERPGNRLTQPAVVRLLGHARAVMADALGEGGTSFDSLYVNVNGESGYFSRELQAYGRGGQPCLRCGSVLVREHFMNRSSFFCPRCQPRPRHP
ncbi:bifunctional DNA-formamidopyrimidine glycosylase/DNA-(apurinic or apyrimidinic site) lyase [Nostocoides sp.]|uniref:bifunctional DNA-formamidopyrimidine glycosylase/DNA-(apurinic or apyrimidinic site) lyase n=1 Tax=Nostocoides sp. TaxID=1917966 RepID=UPI002C3091B1|nr:bifunctional DNA-formamidopyrimidine glycosylase/DNA-(apurinic or apyrimidinic site) lyase [Tetrasphaera sp.]